MYGNATLEEARIAPQRSVPLPWLRTPEFADLSPSARQALLAASIRRQFRPNEFIYLQDDHAQSFFFVLEGHVRISFLMEDGSAVLCAILLPGDSFGELGVFEGGSHCDMATAVGPAVVSAVPMRGLNALMTRHEEIRHALGRLVARRFRSYIELTRDLSLRTLPARLAKAVLRLSDGLGTTVIWNGRRVPCLGGMVTQTDLGLMARGARGNVNRALKAWEREGWILMRDRTILILDRSRLEALALEEDIAC